MVLISNASSLGSCAAGAASDLGVPVSTIYRLPSDPKRNELARTNLLVNSLRFGPQLLQARLG